MAMIDWTPTIQQCAPQVALSTMQAVIRTESGFKPNALNVNGKARLARQPRSRSEAASWAQWLIARGYSVDMGLMQINSANLARLGLNANTVFDPCRNLQAGASILVDNYKRAKLKTDNSHAALLKAISAYNTGNFHGGFRNGYVARVTQVPTISPENNESAPPLIVAKASQKKDKSTKRKSELSNSRQIETNIAKQQSPKSTQQLEARWAKAEANPHLASTEIEGFSIQ